MLIQHNSPPFDCQEEFLAIYYIYDSRAKEKYNYPKAEIPRTGNPVLRKKIGIFGSTAKGRSTAKSDIDVLVEFSEPVGFFHFLHLEEFLRRLLKRKIDLVTKNALKSITKKAILQETIYVKSRNRMGNDS